MQDFDFDIDECLLVFPANPYADKPADPVAALERLEEVFLSEELEIAKVATAMISVDGSTFEFVGTLVVERTFDQGRRRLIRITDVKPLPIPISIQELKLSLDDAFVELLVTRGKRREREFPRWAARRLSSQLRAKWAESYNVYSDQLESALIQLKKDATGKTYLSHAQEIVAMEKDAINVGLRIFDKKGQLHKQVLGGGSDSTDSTGEVIDVPKNALEALDSEPTPFLMSLPGVRVSEDAMIHHDATVFGDWSMQSAVMIGATEFSLGNDCVTIFYANRNNLEHTLGVDLIYYHHTYKAYIGVQYKKLRSGTVRSARYYPDKNLPKELARMRALAGIAATTSSFSDTLDYRLHSGMMHLKLCSSIDFKPDDSGLTRGYIVPLDLWDLFFNPGASPAPKSFSADQLGRVIGNDIFIKMVQDGWIGSRAVQASTIKQIIDAALGEAHAVVLMSSKPCADATRT